MSPNSRWNKFWDVGYGNMVLRSLSESVVDPVIQGAIKDVLFADDEPSREDINGTIRQIKRNVDSFCAAVEAIEGNREWQS